MPVYVDAIADCQTNRNWRWNQACHMYADTLDELQHMAVQIGLKLVWFQDHKELPHYDLTPGMRARAIGHGAVITDKEHLASYMRQRRKAMKTGSR